MPLLRTAPRPGRARLPPLQRVPALSTHADVPANPALDPFDGAALDAACARLADAPMTVVGQILDASNGVLLVRLDDDEGTLHGVYKPVAGEQPLWDFPLGSLAAREVATYELSRAGGYGVVPPTVLRDGEHGIGSVQWWIATDPDADPPCDVVEPQHLTPGLLPVLHAETDDGSPLVVVHREHPALQRVALLDVVANNADRKGSALLVDDAGHPWGIDHGLCLHAEPKLRTVLWGWAGSALPGPCRDLLAATRDALPTLDLAGLLTPEEVDALHARVHDLLDARHWPMPRPGRPAIPWPIL